MNSSAEGQKPEPYFVFLDRDGTLILEKDYLHALAQVEFIPGSAAALARLNRAGAKAVLVSNQSGVGRGYFTADFVRQTHDYLQSELEKHGAHLDAFYFCPHLPEDDCPCRKPRTGMLEQAANELQMPLQGFMIGDRRSDIETGRRAGLRSILVRTGYGEQALQAGELDADMVVPDLRAAVEWILQRQPFTF